MTTFVAWDDVQATREQLGTPGSEILRTHFLKPDPRTREPQAFLVEYAPARALRAHFHDVDEFQIVMAGEGMLGKHAIAPHAVHFASAFTPYGPIAAGAQGLSFLTLRARRDSAGPQLLPDKRQALADAPERHPWQVSESVELMHRGGSVQTRPLPRLTGRRGLAAWVVDIPCDLSMQLPSAQGTGGRYVVVLRGSIRLDSRTVQAPSLAFALAGAAPSNIASGSGGAALIVLDFPDMSSIPRPEKKQDRRLIQ